MSNIDKRVLEIIEDISSKNDDKLKSHFENNKVIFQSETEITKDFYSNNITVSDNNNNKGYMVRVILGHKSDTPEIKVFEKEVVRGEDRFGLVLGKHKENVLDEISRLYQLNLLNENEDKKKIGVTEKIKSIIFPNKLGSNLDIVLKTNNKRLISLFEQFKGEERESWESENYIIDVWSFKKSPNHPEGEKQIQIYDKNKWERIIAKTTIDNDNYDIKLSKNGKSFHISDSKLTSLLLPAMIEIKEHLQERKIENVYIKELSPNIDEVSDKVRYRGF